MERFCWGCDYCQAYYTYSNEAIDANNYGKSLVCPLGHA